MRKKKLIFKVNELENEVATLKMLLDAQKMKNEEIKRQSDEDMAINKELMHKNESLRAELNEKTEILEDREERIKSLEVEVSDYESKIAQIKARCFNLEKSNSELKQSYNTVLEENASLKEKLNSASEKVKLFEGNNTDSIGPKPIISSEHSLDDDSVKLASEAISKVVLKAAALGNKVADSHSEHSKDILSLTLGRTEMFKSQVLSVVQADVSNDRKGEELKKLLTETVEYFDSLEGQI